MRKIFILTIFLLYFFAHSQNITILDRNTNQPIPFVTVILINNGTEGSGVYADENGVLFLPENAIYDSLKFLSLSYEDAIIAKRELKNTIYMVGKPILLNEVTINFTRKLKDTLIGEYNVKRYKKMPLAIQNQMAVFFENPFRNEVPLKELRLKAHMVKYKTAIRIHFFCRYDYVQKLYITGDPDKKFVPHDSFIPGDEITNRDIITYIIPGDKELNINLLDYNIILPYDGIFAGIECLGYFDESGEPINIESKHATQLQFHKTNLDNYCVKIKLGGGFWKNENRHMKADTFMMGVTLDKDSYQAPTMGLVVSH